MGKKRIITKEGEAGANAAKGPAKSGKKKLDQALLYIEATYNNTRVSLMDRTGALYFWSTSGALGFKGAKKGTPFAAGKVGDLVAEKAEAMGVKEVDVIIKGVGAGREAAIRSFAARGILINGIKDTTPVPFNGPKAKKPRRV